MHSIIFIWFIFWEEDSWTAYFAACLYIGIHDHSQIENIYIFDFFPLFTNLMWTVGIVMWRPMFLFHVKVVHKEGSTAELHLTEV